jgi:hypothetical protein
MSDLPSTIHSPDTFLASPPAGFDGVFDWSWTVGCWPNPRDKPMDLDFFKERCGQFLVAETKADEDVRVPIGQRIAFDRLWNLGCFTILMIYGKPWPTHAVARCCKDIGGGEIRLRDVHHLRQFVTRWYRWAETDGARYRPAGREGAR